MEEKLVKSYRITQPGFSMMNLMKDICEGFLEVGTNTIHDDTVSCADAHSNPVAPKEWETHDVLNRNVKRQLTNSERSKNNLALADLKSSTSRSTVIVQKQHFPHDILSSTYYIDDITRREEDLEISLINDLNNGQHPMFKYIPRNITYHRAHAKVAFSSISDDNCCSNCFGDCLSSEIRCACADNTGGKFAYLPGGIVKEEFLEDFILMNCSPHQKNLCYCEECPLERSKDSSLSGTCNGHLVRKFIKECWYKCGCAQGCGNRIVLRGVHRLQVFMTLEGKGWGLRTLEDLPKGAFVCEYVGEILTHMELSERNSLNTGKKNTYSVLVDAGWSTKRVLKDEETLCLDATFYGNVARFINHSCDNANLVGIPVEVKTPGHHYYHNLLIILNLPLAFFTSRKVDALEELTRDYGIDFSDHTHLVKAFRCCCGSQFCRDKKA
ncbi:histone-lysine N-methyltransferase SUVR4-like [Coffea eugenioides]|uniref:histone-lysine N-methyltransferase SUVR4-like n=1 Tax=Coffea eugenioides TaxID=49369 RepID=UPI000F61205E|nr:histone-lysine N-methyltransferase SUVR4-like [Coffea eugenioides]